MRLNDLFENKIPLIQKPYLQAAPRVMLEGIDHPEDRIMAQGSAGANKVVAELTGLEKDAETVSIKWDGFPAVIFGRDSTGKLVFVDKHMYDKVAKGKMEFMTIRAYDQERGANRSDLWEKESILRPILERIVPKNKNKFWMGDLMWTGTPKTKDGFYTFLPNTVEYQVQIDSDLGQQISKSAGGIAVHTKIAGLGQDDVPLRGLEGLPEDQGIVFLTGEIKDSKPRVLVNKTFLADAKKIIAENSKVVDKFLEDIAAMKGKTVVTAMGPFITSMLEEGDIKNDIVPRFMEFLGDRLTDAAADKFLGKNKDGWLYQANGGAPGLLGLWKMWATITDLKIHIKKQIDAQLEGGEVRAIINGAHSHEGYVFGAGKDKLKIVDRLGFSAANFAKHKPSPEDIAAKSKMPMAAFCFGRMNPPTLGHELVMKKTVELGVTNSFIFLSNSVNSSTDPLDPATKAAFIKKIYPKFASHIVNDPVQNPIFAANWLYAKGFRNMTFVAGSDRLGKGKGSIEKLLNGWNSGPVRTTDSQFGPEGREHVVLNFVSSGDRDPDAEGVSGYSGSKARAAAAAGDEKLFKSYTGVGSEIKISGKTLFQAVRDGMGAKDATLKENVLTELRSLADGGYGGWINASGNEIHPLGSDDTSHMDAAIDLGIDMRHDTDYRPAYQHHLVRYVTQEFPRYFELSGRYEDLRSTFRQWWPTAVKAEHVYIDMIRGQEEVFKDYEPADPASRAAMRRDFGQD